MSFLIKHTLDKLQRLQNRCLKICSGRDRLLSTYKTSHVPFLKDRRQVHKLNFMYKRLLCTELLNTREIQTRAQDAPLFNVIVPRGEALKRSVGYSGSVLWNELSPNINNTASYLEFRNIKIKAMFQPLLLP